VDRLRSAVALRLIATELGITAAVLFLGLSCLGVLLAVPRSSRRVLALTAIDRYNGPIPRSMRTRRKRRSDFARMNSGRRC